MAINNHQLEGYLARKPNAMDPLWLVTGEDPLLLREAVDTLRQRARTLDYNERQVLDLDARSDFSQMSAFALGVGLFDDKKILECRLASAKPGTKGASALTHFVQRSYDNVIVIFSIPTPEWQAQKAAWWGALKKQTTVVECVPVTRANLPLWLKNRLESKGLTADSHALDVFADMVEGNLFAANQEIEKLSLIHQNKTLTIEDIQACVANCSRFEVDSLLSNICSGHADRAAQVVDGLKAQNIALPLILVTLTDFIRKLIRVRDLVDQGQTLNNAMRSARVYMPKLRLEQAASRLPVKRLSAALQTCAELDRLSKGLIVPSRENDPWVELQSIVIFLSR